MKGMHKGTAPNRKVAVAVYASESRHAQPPTPSYQRSQNFSWRKSLLLQSAIGSKPILLTFRLAFGTVTQARKKKKEKKYKSLLYVRRSIPWTCPKHLHDRTWLNLIDMKMVTTVKDVSVKVSRLYEQFTDFKNAHRPVLVLLFSVFYELPGRPIYSYGYSSCK